MVQRLEQDFKVTLQQQNSLEQWAAWLDGVVSQVLKPYQGSAGFPKAAKLFLLKWSFYRCALAGRDAGGEGAGWEDDPPTRAGPREGSFALGSGQNGTSEGSASSRRVGLDERPSPTLSGWTRESPTPWGDSGAF